MSENNERSQEPVRPDGNAQHRRPSYEAAGGEDSSPFEGVPSGELHEAAQEPQNAAPETK